MRTLFPPSMRVAREGKVVVLAVRVRPVRVYAHGRSRTLPREVWCQVTTMFPNANTRQQVPRGHIWASFGVPRDPRAKLPPVEEFLRDPVHKDYRHPARRFVLFSSLSLQHSLNKGGEPVLGFSVNEHTERGRDRDLPLDYHIGGSSYARVVQALLGPDDGSDLPDSDLDSTLGPYRAEE